MVVIAALYWGNELSIKLPEFDSRFDHKPFNCRPCLTFHFVWQLCAVFALVLWSIKLLVYGFVAAFLVFLILKIIDNKKITK